MFQGPHNWIDLGIDAAEFPFHHAGDRPVGPRSLCIGDRSTEKKRLVPSGQRAIVSRVKPFLSGLGGGG